MSLMLVSSKEWFSVNHEEITVGKICRMVDIFSSSAKLGIYIPKFYRRFKNYILHVVGSYFSVAWFSMCRKCPLHSVRTTLYPGLHLRSHLLGCCVFKYTLSPIWKEAGCLSVVFHAVLKWFSSRGLCGDC